MRQSLPGKSNTVEDCSNDRTPHTTCVSDDDELRRVEEVAAEAEGEIKRLSAELEQSSGRLTQASETCKRCFADLNGVRESINRRSKLHSDIRERQIREVFHSPVSHLRFSVAICCNS